MQRHVLSIDHGGKWKLLECFDDSFIGFFIKLSDHLLSKVVISRTLTSLVIAPKQVDHVREPDL